MAEDIRRFDNRPTPVGFDYEAPLLAPLPFEEFDVGLTLTPKVDKTSRITVRQPHCQERGAIGSVTAWR
ncbi:hypothetical protein [Streptomyces sp. NPDC004267]|uniref:hypothetical protein n=1 Tax=Streptomyces sp. NPDC004267 TaxID=3364694 RepID=UPI0036B7299A